MGRASDADVTIHNTVIAVILADDNENGGGGGVGGGGWWHKFLKIVLKTRLTVVLGGGKLNIMHILNLVVGLIALSAGCSDRLYSWYPGDMEGGSTTASLEAKWRRENSLPYSGRHWVWYMNDNSVQIMYAQLVSHTHTHNTVFLKPRWYGICWMGRCTYRIRWLQPTSFMQRETSCMKLSFLFRIRRRKKCVTMIFLSTKF